MHAQHAAGDTLGVDIASHRQPQVVAACLADDGSLAGQLSLAADSLALVEVVELLLVALEVAGEIGRPHAGLVLFTELRANLFALRHRYDAVVATGMSASGATTTPS